MKREIYGRVIKVKGNQLVFEVDNISELANLFGSTDDANPVGRVTITDSRSISPHQMKKAYALMNDIADYMGIPRNEIKSLMKSEWVAETGEPEFSFGSVDMTTAREFITFLLEFAIRWRIPLRKTGLEYQDDIEAYMVMSLRNRSCVICGKRADIHHTDTIGMGNDRRATDHRKHRLIALCRIHHNQAHNVGWSTFSELYHVEGVCLDATQLIDLGLMTKKQIEEFDNDQARKTT